MLGIVLPVVTSASGPLRRMVDIRSVVMVDEVVVDVDVDVIAVAPSTVVPPASPQAAPIAIPTPNEMAIPAT